MIKNNNIDVAFINALYVANNNNINMTSMLIGRLNSIGYAMQVYPSFYLSIGSGKLGGIILSRYPIVSTNIYHFYN